MATLTHHSIEEDFACWAFETADLLEGRRFDELDLAALVEEVRDLGRSENRSVVSQFERLLTHLMKFAYQPDKRSTSWEASIVDARIELEKLLEESPSLRSKLDSKGTAQSWQRARRRAVVQTRLLPSSFPDLCLWDLDTQILNPDWLP